MLRAFRKLLPLVFPLLVLCSPATWAQESFPNEPNGFRGLAWGAKEAELPDTFKHIQTLKDGGKVYQRRDEIMLIGKVVLSQVRYVFYDGTLRQAFVVLSNHQPRSLIDAKTAVYAELTKTFGKPNKAESPSIRHYLWEGAKTRIEMGDPNTKFVPLPSFGKKKDEPPKVLGDLRFVSVQLPPKSSTPRTDF